MIDQEPPESGVRGLKVDLDNLGIAFEDSSWEHNWYLDLETGRVLNVSDETRRELNLLYEQAGGGETGLERALEEQEIPSWRKELIREADLVEEAYPARFVEVPRPESSEGYQDMEDFIGTVENPRLRAQLERAIDGRGPFRRFKEVLRDHRSELDRWYRFQEEAVRGRLFRWLESQGIRISNGDGLQG